MTVAITGNWNERYEIKIIAYDMPCYNVTSCCSMLLERCSLHACPAAKLSILHYLTVTDECAAAWSAIQFFFAAEDSESSPSTPEDTDSSSGK